MVGVGWISKILVLKLFLTPSLVQSHFYMYFFQYFSNGLTKNVLEQIKNLFPSFNTQP